MRVQIEYRRTLEQLQAVVSATSPEAVYSLLQAALIQDRTELAVRIGYWTADGQAQVERAVEDLRASYGMEESPPWETIYYPNPESAGLVEFLLESVEEEAQTGADLEQSDGILTEDGEENSGHGESPVSSPETVPGT